LPAEIRNHIYGFLLEENNGSVLKFIPKRHFDVYMEDFSPERLTPYLDDLTAFDLTSQRLLLPKGLIASCRQLYCELLPLAYAKLRICVMIMQFNIPWDTHRARFEDGGDMWFKELPKTFTNNLTLLVWQDPSYCWLKNMDIPKSSDANITMITELPHLAGISCCILIEDNDGIGFEFAYTIRRFSPKSDGVKTELTDLSSPTERVREDLDAICTDTILPIVVAELMGHIPPAVDFKWFDASDHDCPNSHRTVLGKHYLKETDFVATSETRKKTWFRDLTGPRQSFEIVPKNILEVLQRRLEMGQLGKDTSNHDVE
jgi:hypothetical protein